MHTYAHALIYTLAHKKPIQPLDSSPLIAQYEQWNIIYMKDQVQVAIKNTVQPQKQATTFPVCPLLLCYWVPFKAYL